MDKDQLILEMLQAGKSYSDIMATLNVSPTRIIVVKKKFLQSNDTALLGTTTTTHTTTRLSEEELKTLKEKLREKALQLKLLIFEKEHFATKGLLWARLRKLGYAGTYEQIVVKQGTTKILRIALQNYIIGRISFKEYTLEQGDKI